VVRVEGNGGTDEALTLHVSVSDTGIGIPGEKHAAVFAPFEQADNSMARRYGGTGLGLAISARLVELMGGHFWLESEVGRGSTFHFTARMGLQPDTVQAAPAGSPGGPQAGLPDCGKAVKRGSGERILRPLRILLAEDNLTNQKIVEGMLGTAGHRVVVANSGKGALAALGLDTFDVVLMDIQRPEMNGMEATAAIRRKEAGTGRRTRSLP
jgi:CheY-like chemotaxis protein